MIAECTTCKARYRVADERVRPQGTKFKCKKCGNYFHVFPPAPASPAEDKQPRRPRLKRCPSCGQGIPLEAVKCRYCGSLADEAASGLEQEDAFAPGGGQYSPEPGHTGGYSGAVTVRPGHASAMPTRGKKINPYLFTFPLWIGLIAIVFGNLSIENRSEAAGALFIIAGVASLIFALVYGFISLYRAWNVIPEGYARTTPGKAVGFMFIPLFNLYWVFVAVKGLADDARSFLAGSGVRESKLSSGLALTYCIFHIVGGFLPFVPIVTMVLATILVHQWAGFVKYVIDNPALAQQAYQPGQQRRSDGAATVAIVLAAVFGGIAVLGILAAIAIPAFLGQREKARMRAVEAHHLEAVNLVREEISKCAANRWEVTEDVVADLNARAMSNPFAEEMEAFSYQPGRGQVAISRSHLRSICGTTTEVVVASDTDGDGNLDLRDSIQAR